MYDRPTAGELLNAARAFLEHSVVPVIKNDRKLYFQMLVTINVLRIVERELDLKAAYMRQEWEQLNQLEGVSLNLPETMEEWESALQTRIQHLCDAIRGEQHISSSQLLNYLLMTTQSQLEVSNPKFLEALLKEQA